jgi:MoxR-like ATPase
VAEDGTVAVPLVGGTSDDPGALPARPGGAPAADGAGPALEQAVSSVVLDQGFAVRFAVAAFVAGGHVLLEDVPGVGKTLFAKALARGVGGTFGRVQGTSDLLPTDLTGVSTFDPEARSWRFEPGPLFHHVVLVDELNRATPRTQAALLEAMAERQVTVDGETYLLPDPFLVVATQNPQGDLGTFPLVGGQRDRFMVSLSLGLASREAELHLVAGHGGTRALSDVAPVAGLPVWAELRHQLDEVHADAAVLEYAVDLAGAVRQAVGGWTPSTRATLDLVRFAKAHAVVTGRNYVAPDDVQVSAVPVLAHRILDATRTGLPAAQVLVDDIVRTKVPPPERPSVRW